LGKETFDNTPWMINDGAVHTKKVRNRHFDENLLKSFFFVSLRVSSWMGF